MLYMPNTLVIHEVLLSVCNNLHHQTRYARLITEFRDWSKKSLEIENHRTRQGQTSESLPVNPQVTLVNGQIIPLR